MAASHTFSQTSAADLFRIACALILGATACEAALAAPQVNGDITISNSRVGTVIVLPPKLKVGVGLGTSGRTPLQLTLPMPKRPANINSVVLLGNAQVGGNITIDGATSRRLLLPNGSNVNSVVGR